MELSLNGVFEALEAPIGLIDSPERQAEIRRFVAAGRVYQERAIFELFSDVAMTINEAGVGARVRLEYQSGSLHLTVDAEGDTEDEFGAPVGSELERITLRLPVPLKRTVNEAAAARGVSVNSWCVRALGRAARKHQEHEHHESEEHAHDRRPRDHASGDLPDGNEAQHTEPAAHRD